MISEKIFNVTGKTNRYLSDFIIRSEMFVRPYVFIFDNTLQADELEDPNSPWSYPDNLWKRIDNVPDPSKDVISISNWTIVDNSVLFYVEPPVGASLYLEVATTEDEFGETIVSGSVESAINAFILV